MFKNILVATDFSECSQRAVALALDIARRFDAKLTLVHAYEIPSYVYGGVAFSPADLITPIETAEREALKQTFDDLHAAWPSSTSVLVNGVAAAEILAVAARTGADLIVLGTHGRRGMSRAFLGSVAEKVVRLANVPVLTTRG